MKKITAIVLCVLLAMSALVVLTACGTTEYVVTFRDYNSKILFQGKTINGKAVEGRNPTREGYKFDGWYKSLTGDAEGNLIYAEPMDFDKNVETDLDLYAKWSKLGGEAEGYCIIGDAVGNWDPAASKLSDRLTQDPKNPDLYVIEMDAPKDKGFKVKTFYPDWDTPEINYGVDKLNEVTLAEGVTIPASLGIEKARDLFSAKDNITAVAADLKIKLTFNYADKNFDILVTKITVPAPAGEEPCATGYRIAGNIDGVNAWNSNDGGYAMTKDADANVYTKDIVLRAGEGFKVKENLFAADGTPNWDTSFGFDKLKEVKLDTGVDLPGDVTGAANLFVNDGGNIKSVKACEITVTFDFATKEITILVTAFSA